MTRKVKSKDYDIRAAMVGHLMAEGVARGDIRHEITLDTSSSGGRADIVVLSPSALLGIEVKSESDTVKRLAGQIDNYRRAFDIVRVVCDVKHRDKIVVASDFWSANQGFVMFVRGEPHPHPARLTAGMRPVSGDGWRRRPAVHGALARLLWRSEILSVSSCLGGPYGARVTREDAIEWLCEEARLSEMRPLVVEALRAREHNRWEAAFWRRFDAQGETAGGRVGGSESEDA